VIRDALSDASYDILEEKCTEKLWGDDNAETDLQARFKKMAQHDRDVFLNEIASEAEVDALKGKIGSVFQAVRIVTGNDLSSLQTPVNRSDGS